MLPHHPHSSDDGAVGDGRRPVHRQCVEPVGMWVDLLLELHGGPLSRRRLGGGDRVGGLRRYRRRRRVQVQVDDAGVFQLGLLRNVLFIYHIDLCEIMNETFPY